MTEQHYAIHISSQERTIVSVDDFAVIPDDITFLFGESGIGKSILSKAIYGLLDPDALHITINNRPYASHLKSRWVDDIQRNSFFVFQEPSSHLNALMKISEQLSEGSLRHAGNEQEILHHLWMSSRDTDIRRIIDIYPKPYRPSGGEKQRVLLAMAFKKLNVIQKINAAEKTTFFVFDEPTGSLDDTYRNLFLALLFDAYKRHPFTGMFITHDYSIISEIVKKYSPLLDHIHFRELTRKKDTAVYMHDFSADEYLTWLDNTEPARVSSTREKDTAVLRVDPQFTIFNRSLSIYEDPEHTRMKEFVINKGEMVYLKAPSGVGKTTLAKIVMGLYSAQKFSMRLCGMPVTERTDIKVWQKKIWGKRAGMVFQHADEALNLHANVKEIFTGLPFVKKLSVDLLRLRLSELFDHTITETFLNKRVGFLSGGQKQRLNLLRTLIMDTDLVILDEPLNGLDFLSIKKVLGILEVKRREGTALLMISHNEEIFDHLVDHHHIYYLA